MQVNDLVQVATAKHEHTGRAGHVQAVDVKTEIASVMLDESETHEGGLVDVDFADLKFLGR
jgi:hypothetical protein